MESLHKLSEAIFELKDKLTDSEFKNLYDISKQIHDKIQPKDVLPVTHIVPGYNSGHVRFHGSPIRNTEFRRQMENSRQRALMTQEIQDSLLRPNFFKRLFTWNWGR